MTKTTIGATGLAGTYGLEGQHRGARIDLCYDPAKGWYLEGETRSASDAIPMDFWHCRKLRYELVWADRLELREEDAPHILAALGGDLPDLLDRIASGHSIGWDGSNLVGYLDAAAYAADEELVSRLDPTNDAKHGVPETWSAEAWLGDDPLEPGDTAESLVAEAERVDGLRIWGGVREMRDEIEVRR